MGNIGASIARLSADGIIPAAMFDDGAWEYPNMPLGSNEKVFGVEPVVTDTLPSVPGLMPVEGVWELRLPAGLEMAFLNRATMALSTPCAALAKGLRSCIAENRSIVHWKCCETLPVSSGCSCGNNM